MNRSRIWTKDGIIVLACDRYGRLGWTPRAGALEAAILDLGLPADHPVMAALADMFAETAVRLVLPHADRVKDFTLEQA